MIFTFEAINELQIQICSGIIQINAILINKVFNKFVNYSNSKRFTYPRASNPQFQDYREQLEVLEIGT